MTSVIKTVTTHELRLECAEAIAKAANISVRRAFLALDSLHGLARIVPIEATEVMVEAGMYVLGLTMKPIVSEEVFHAMAAAGDLTNPPEKKL